MFITNQSFYKNASICVRVGDRKRVREIVCEHRMRETVRERERE